MESAIVILDLECARTFVSIYDVNAPNQIAAGVKASQTTSVVGLGREATKLISIFMDVARIAKEKQTKREAERIQIRNSRIQKKMSHNVTFICQLQMYMKIEANVKSSDFKNGYCWHNVQQLRL